MISDKPAAESQAERERAREWYVEKLKVLPPNYDPSYWMNVIDLLSEFSAFEVRAATAREREACRKELKHVLCGQSVTLVGK